MRVTTKNEMKMDVGRRLAVCKVENGREELSEEKSLRLKSVKTSDDVEGLFERRRS
jgi:hypothetical protein